MQPKLEAALPSGLLSAQQSRALSVPNSFASGSASNEAAQSNEKRFATLSMGQPRSGESAEHQRPGNIETAFASPS
jgi:hypothetical protein